MSGFFTENRKFYLDLVDLEEIIKDLENDFQDNSSNSLHSLEEAKTFYNMALENAGKICEEFIAPRAEAVDEKGATIKDGVVSWAKETQENMKILAQAGYMGGTLPRKYGGLNLPVTINNIIVEMVSQADASLMNLFGLQDIAVTLYKFGNEEQKDRVLPKFCSGEVSGSMALTEPDAGSDLQAVTLKAIEKDGKWYLDGVKRFITNGSGEVSLVLARSEEGTKGGRGLSMFLYERYKDDKMIVRRIENKHGIHGSPTCELQFNMAEAELVGKRKYGLIKYVMSLMNGARLAVSAQALGIAQAAYDEALKYAKERDQFGSQIIDFPAVYQMLLNMKAEIETSRILLYETSKAVDYEDMYERKLQKGDKEAKKAGKYWTVLANYLTPLSKFTITEMGNKVCYDALQIHGGVGFMKDFPIERLSRDIRITNIYEGTTQLQVVAAIGAITSGFFFKEMEKMKEYKCEKMKHELGMIQVLISDFEAIVEKVKETKNKELLDFVAGYFVEISSILYRSYLYLPIAEKFEDKRELFRFFVTEKTSKINYLIAKTENAMKQYNGEVKSLKEKLL